MRTLLATATLDTEGLEEDYVSVYDVIGHALIGNYKS